MKRALHSGLEGRTRAIAAIASMWPLCRSARPTQRIDRSLGLVADQACMSSPLGTARWAARRPGKSARKRLKAYSLTKAKPESRRISWPPEGAVKRARRRFHIGVGMQNHPRSRGQRDERRRGQMIFDNGEIDAATPQQLGDAPGFPEVAADSGSGIVAISTPSNGSSTGGQTTSVVRAYRL